MDQYVVIDPAPTAGQIEAAGQAVFYFTAPIEVEPLPEHLPPTVAALDGYGREHFAAWLLKQASREDWIGDLARAAKSDPGFPRVGTPDEVGGRLMGLTGGGDAYEALDAAEEEWMAG